MSVWALVRWIVFGLMALIAVAALGLGWAASWNLERAAGLVGQVWTDYANVIDRIYNFIDRTARFIVPIATIGGAIYGVYHKWQFSKSRMHVHIQEFLKRDDKRLMPSGKTLRQIVGRPGAAGEFGASIFSVEVLEPTLEKMRWGKLSKADAALASELIKLQRQLEQWGNLEVNYNRHKAQAHLLKGAIAASRAASGKNSSEDRRKQDVEAFEQFKAAHELDKTDVESLEYMAHQRVRLGDNSSALGDFEKLQELAEKQQNALLHARALKFQSAIREHEGATRLIQDPSLRANLEPNLQKARDLLGNALEILPDGERGGLEEAELHEIRGRVQKERQRFTAATNDYTSAERLYDRIAQKSNDPDRREAAKAGSARVTSELKQIRLRPLSQPSATLNGTDDEPPLDGLSTDTAVLHQPPNTDLTTKPTA